MAEQPFTRVKVCDSEIPLANPKQKLRIEMRLSSKALWRTLLTNENFRNIHRRSIKFLRMLYEQKCCKLGLRQYETKNNKARSVYQW